VTVSDCIHRKAGARAGQRQAIRDSYLVKKLYDWATSSTDTATTIQQQKEAAVEVIRAGRENGAEEIELEMDETAGLDLKGKLRSGETLETKIGKSGRMTLKVKYKRT
jgi:hypothetical protein